ncbi:hypothetical protein [Micromonospora sp. NPDC000018]|uniref:hypothetical protein n=1 Tax=Micromonospora sp. NPDC000018 TaxID=3154239 RepID=UPI0033192F47
MPGEPFSGRELLWEGGAAALLGIGNLAGGLWVLLTIPALVVIVVLVVRLLTGGAGTDAEHADGTARVLRPPGHTIGRRPRRHRADDR